MPRSLQIFKAEPACRLFRILHGPAAGQIEPPQMVLGIGVAEVRRRVAEHFAGTFRVRLDRRIRHAVQIIVSKRHEGVGDKPRPAACRAYRPRAHRQCRGILEGANIIAADAVAIGIHLAKLPLSDRVSVGGCVFQSRNALRGIAGLQGLRTRAERIYGRRLARQIERTGLRQFREPELGV